jgi:hypothetical protein
MEKDNMPERRWRRWPTIEASRMDTEENDDNTEKKDEELWRE